MGLATLLSPHVGGANVLITLGCVGFVVVVVVVVVVMKSN